jgi:cation diffusion facilitator family transporter
MISLLSKIFIEGKELDDSSKRSLYGTMCSIVGIMLNVCLFAIKYFAGIISGSIAITADAFNNLSDAGSSFITLVGFVYSGKKPDADHPFGHGRFEYLSGFVVSVIIIVMGVELAKSSIEKIINPVQVTSDALSMAILVISIFVKLYMSFYNKNIGGKIDSAAMKATSVDSLSDATATTVVLLSMIVLKTTGFNVDGFCGIVVSGFILYAGYGAAKDTLAPLLGTQPDSTFVEEIYKTVLSHEEIIGMHDLVVHDYGPGRRMISLHAEVPGNGDIYVLHDKIDLIEKELRSKLGCEAVIHMDPMESDNEAIAAVRVKIAAAVKDNVDERITIHDFRMVAGPTHTNVIFDAVVPFEIKESEQEIRKKIEEAVKSINENYFAVVTIDRAYS